MTEDAPHYHESAERRAPRPASDLPAKATRRAAPGGGERETGGGVVEENAGRHATAGEKGT